MTFEFPPSPLWTPDELQRTTDGFWLNEPDPSWFPTGVTYSRTYARPGDIFVTMDARTYARAALKHRNKMPKISASNLGRFVASGMQCAIVQRDLALPTPKGFPVLRVDNSPLAIRDLAIAARKRMGGRVISITGTAGKTTTREMLRHVLARKGRAFSTMENFNNRMGVLLTMAQTPRETDYAVYEVSGSSLCAGLYGEKNASDYYVRSDLAVLTSIGLAHTNIANTIEGIADWKSRIFFNMQPGAAAVINRDVTVFDRVRNWATEAGVRRILTFGESADADMRLLEWEGRADGSFVRASLSGQDVGYFLPIVGKHMVMNSLAVLCGVAALGEDWREAAADLGNYETAQGRLEVHEVTIPDGSFHLVDDAFNATASSMAAGLETLQLMQSSLGGRRLAALGRIVGLGELGPQIMREMGEKVVECGIDRLFTVHDELLELRTVVPESILAPHAETTAELVSRILREVRPGDIVLAKASHRGSDFHLLPQYLRFGLPGEGPVKPDTRGLLARLTGRWPDTDAPRLSLRGGRQGSVCFLGDTYFGETYQSARERRGKRNYLTRKGYGYGLRRFTTMLRAADAVVASFAAPLVTRKPGPPGDTGKRLHWAEPSQTLAALKENNIQAVSLAGARVFDQGKDGLRQSIEFLAGQSFPVFGAGDGEARACRPLLLSSSTADREENIAIFACLRHSEKNDAGFKGCATGRRAGLASIGGAIRSIAAWRGANPNDRIIAFVQWGEPYRWRNGTQERLADELIEAGADLIVGTGAHRFQEIDRRHGKWVVYNLGNFVFGSNGAYKRHDAPGISLIARLILSSPDAANACMLRLYPILTDNRRTLFQPRFLSFAEFRNFLDMLSSPPRSAACDEFGWYLELDIDW